MLNKLTLEEFLEMAQSHQRIAVFREIAIGDKTVISVYEALEDELQNSILLESGTQTNATGQYSFLGLHPLASLSARGKNLSLTINGKTDQFTADPFTTLRELQKRFHCDSKHQTPGFIGGAAGYMSYDAIRLFENIPDRHFDATAIPDLLFHFYRISVVFDHHAQKIIILVATEVDEDAYASFSEAEALIQRIIEKIGAVIPNAVRDLSLEVRSLDCARDDSGVRDDSNARADDIQIDLNDEEYISRVQQAKRYIQRGDAFQIVVSRCFHKKISVPAFKIYRTLRKMNPSPYMFYINYENTTIFGASPEKLVSVQRGEITLNPIAGTRPRGQGLDDAKLENELLQDEKECAEHMMLVDLARNDLGVVCEPGSVKVEALLKIKKFSHVMHLTSLVAGKLCAGLDAFDVLKAVFPAGTLSGAPKIRAMEIIDELEISRRGIYGGAICRIDHEGNMDSCIAIRMAVVKDNTATVRAGGGIVFDSNPQMEADETRHKARAVLEAMRVAERGES